MVKLSGLRTVVPMIEEGSRLKVSGNLKTVVYSTDVLSVCLKVGGTKSGTLTFVVFSHCFSPLSHFPLSSYPLPFLLPLPRLLPPTSPSSSIHFPLSFPLNSFLPSQAVHGHFSSTVENICWLAPEVLAQDMCGYSFKSDSYSIGIAALELATGEAPFAGLPVTEVHS